MGQQPQRAYQGSCDRSFDRADSWPNEVEVESVAFIVLDLVGLASDDYSFPYVTRWASGDIELVKQSAERSISCAKQMLHPLTALSE